MKCLMCKCHQAVHVLLLQTVYSSAPRLDVDSLITTKTNVWRAAHSQPLQMFCTHCKEELQPLRWFTWLFTGTFPRVIFTGTAAHGSSTSRGTHPMQFSASRSSSTVSWPPQRDILDRTRAVQWMLTQSPQTTIRNFRVCVREREREIRKRFLSGDLAYIVGDWLTNSDQSFE